MRPAKKTKMNSDDCIHVANTSTTTEASMFLDWLEKRCPKTVKVIDALIVVYWLIALLRREKIDDEDLLR